MNVLAITALYVKMPSLSNFVIERQSDLAVPVDTTSNAPSILAINGSFMGFALLIVGARIYVRSIMLKTVGPDDYVIMAAMVSWCSLFLERMSIIDIVLDMQYWCPNLLHRRNTSWNWNAFDGDSTVRTGKASPLAVLSLADRDVRDFAHQGIDRMFLASISGREGV